MTAGSSRGEYVSEALHDLQSAIGDRYRLEREQPHRLVHPEAGLLALFPSFLYHRTVPYHADEERLSIAFDLLPRLASFG